MIAHYDASHLTLKTKQKKIIKESEIRYIRKQNVCFQVF